jgi:hypothetical protein
MVPHFFPAESILPVIMQKQRPYFYPGGPLFFGTFTP